MTLVSIIGDFHSSIFPVFYELKEQLKTHILIYDDFLQDTKRAEHYTQGIEDFKEKHGFTFTTVSHKIDEDAKNSVALLESLFKQHTQSFEELYINTTDGLASLNTQLSLHFVPLGAKMISYDRFDNHGHVVQNSGVERFVLKNSIPIEEYFLLRHRTIVQEAQHQLLIKHKELILHLFRDALDELLGIRRNLDLLYMLKNDTTQIIHKLINAFKPQSDTQFIQGTLYELYIGALILETNCDDVRVGVKIYDETGSYNEFDVLIMHQNHLHMIECKMARANLNELVYKYMALRDVIDEDGKIAIFTKHEDYYRKAPEHRSDTENVPKKRAQAQGFLTRGFVFGNEEKFFKDLESFFGISKKAN